MVGRQLVIVAAQHPTTLPLWVGWVFLGLALLGFCVLVALIFAALEWLLAKRGLRKMGVYLGLVEDDPELWNERPVQPMERIEITEEQD
jgi:hypothetical protein